MPASAPASRANAVLPSLVALTTLALCSLLAPSVVNGDGLGYLRSAPAGALVSGHLGFLPLLRAVAWLSGSADPLALLLPARVLCWLSAALAAAALAVTARRLAGPAAATIAALGMVASSGFLEAGADVESYAPSLAALCVALALGVARAQGGGVGSALGCALATAVAVLFHVENVLFLPVAVLLAARRPRDLLSSLLLVGGVAGALVLAAYTTAAHARGDDLVSAIGWIRGASHGFSYPLGPASPFIALYGIAKTLVWAPYHYEASWARVIACTTLGLIAAATMIWLARRPGRPRTVGPLVALAWAVPYAAVGVLFFASDSERWLFLLPLAWLAVGAGAATSARALRVGQLLVGAMVLANLALGVPRALDHSRRARADEVATRMAPGDLVISPGHSWDEYVGFYQPLALDHFPIIFFCGQLGGAEPMAVELRRRAERAVAEGHALWLLRGDESERTPGWKDLAQFGLAPANIDRVLPGRRAPIAPGVERLWLRITRETSYP